MGETLSMRPSLGESRTNYYTALQQVKVQGTIIGHTPFVMRAIDSLESTKPLDPTVFAFLKGVNTPVLTPLFPPRLTLT